MSWNHSESDLLVIGTWLGAQLKLAVRLSGVVNCFTALQQTCCKPKGQQLSSFSAPRGSCSSGLHALKSFPGLELCSTISISFPVCRWDPLANNVLTSFIMTLAVPGSLPSLVCPSTAQAVWHVSQGEQLFCCLVSSVFCSEISGTVKLFLC